ncbi:4-vinyl reductase [archaeon]|nr:4-vinyl reductase [archaeon]
MSKIHVKRILRKRLRVKPRILSEDRVYQELRRVLGKSWPIRFYADRRSHISFLDSRWILVDTAYFPYMFVEAVRETLGVPCQQVLYQMGVRVGSVVAKRYADKGLSGDPLILTAAAVAARLGWGLLYPIELGEKSFQVIGYNTFESDSYLRNKARSKGSACFFLAGVIAGLAQHYYNRPCEVREVKCRARGNAFCLFKGSVLQ